MKYFHNEAAPATALDRHTGRRDTTSAQTVDIGIRLQEVLGTRDAAEFLQGNAIDIAVALRALLSPARRRAPDATVEA